MSFELPSFDLPLAVLVVSRNVVQDSVYKFSDVRVLVLEQFKYNLNHVCVVNYVVSS